jgi:serine/threonine-protein kinase
MILGGRYRIDRFLGEGGMGIVYQATHLPLDHPVAIKVLRRSVVLTRRAAQERFRHEAKVAIAMDHPNLVRVFDYSVEPTELLVMELIDGSTVERLLHEAGRLEVPAALRIAADVFDGMACLHAGGIVHRDIKPGNVMIRRHDTRVKLSDFGLALDLKAVRWPDQGVHGTPPYMAPEIVVGQDAGPASDVFAAGVMLFEMLTGRRPWRGNTVRELWDNMARTPPCLPSELGLALHTDIVWLLLRCLEREPHNRFADGMEAAEALRGILQAQGAGSREQRLFRNRVALVLPDPDLANVLQGALSGGGLLDPVLAVSSPSSPCLASFLTRVDAILLDPQSAAPAVVEKFLEEVRQAHPTIVFFLLMPARQQAEILGRFSPAWQQRLGHYFLVPTDQPLAQLPAAIKSIAEKILFDHGSGGRSRPTGAGLRTGSSSTASGVRERPTR